MFVATSPVDSMFDGRLQFSYAKECSYVVIYVGPHRIILCLSIDMELTMQMGGILCKGTHLHGLHHMRMDTLS